MIRSRWPWPFLQALLALSLAASSASAASSFSNTLTGFTGNSTQPATQAALAAAGFNFESTAEDTQVQFDSSGAHFGDLFFGNDGRNYLRTNESDYANVSFVAEITMVAPDIDSNDGYFGLGAGQAAAFRTPDWTTEFTSVMYWGETELAEPSVDTFAVRNGQGPFVTTPAPTLTDGTHRVRLTYDWFQKTATFAFDFNYASGPFTAELTAPPLDVLSHYAADSWPAEPARIFFGGGSSVVFKDIQVTVSTPSMRMGDFNADGALTTADWGILRSNQHADLSGKTFQQAYVMGDLTADLANNHEDFAAFKTFYETANGVGSFAAMLGSVPEASTSVLISSAAVFVLPAAGRWRNLNRCQSCR